MFRHFSRTFFFFTKSKIVLIPSDGSSPCMNSLFLCEIMWFYHILQVLVSQVCYLGVNSWIFLWLFFFTFYFSLIFSNPIPVHTIHIAYILWYFQFYPWCKFYPHVILNYSIQFISRKKCQQKQFCKNNKIITPSPHHPITPSPHHPITPLSHNPSR
jgi:hypothetical protein